MPTEPAPKDPFASQSADEDQPARSEADSSRLVDALRRYQADIDSAREPDVAALLADYGDVADELSACLKSMEFLNSARPDLDALDAVALPELNVMLGDFLLLRELGRGGMGVVFEAEQRSLRRKVAVKVLPFAAMLDRRQLTRFQNEVTAIATLKHPHIVNILAVGQDRGVYYYAMELIHGQSLSELLVSMSRERPAGHVRRENRGHAVVVRGLTPAVDQEDAGDGECPNVSDRLTRRGSSTKGGSGRSQWFQQVARWGIQACRALQHAHDHGIIHRDIKPANLLVDDQGQLWVTDFGLALCAGGPQVTRSGDIIGTERYMSPEQASGSRQVDARTDVYSLGITLYELLAGSPAFMAEERPRLIQQVISAEPVPLRRRNRDVPADLATIVGKAISKDPSARYAVAADLADDLQRFLDVRPIQARAPRVMDATWRWARRNPVIATLAMMVGLSLILVAVTASLSARRLAKVARDQSRLRAETAAKLYASDMNRAVLALKLGDLQSAWSLLAQHAGEPQEFESRYLAALCRPAAATHELQHSSTVVDVEFAPEGNWLASSTFGGGFAVHDPTNGQLRWNEKLKGQVSRAVFRNGSQQLVTSSRDGYVRVWDVEQRRELNRKHSTMDPWAIDVSPLTGQIAIGGCEYHITYPGHGRAELLVWDPDQDRVVFETDQVQDKVLDVKFSPDGRWLAVATYDKYVQVLDTTDWKVAARLGPHSAGVFKLAFSGDGRQLATGSGIYNRQFLLGEIQVWAADSWAHQVTYHGHSEKVYGLVFLRDHRTLISTADDGTLAVWDTSRPGSRTPLRSILAHAGMVWDAAVSPDGTMLATGGNDNRVRLWSTAKLLESVEIPEQWTQFERSLINVAFLDGGRRLALKSARGPVAIYDFASGRQLRQFEGPDEMLHMSFSDAHRLVALCDGAADADRRLTAYDYDTGELRWQRQIGAVGGAEFDSQGQWIAACSGSDVHILQQSDGTPRHRLHLEGTELVTVRFSRDGRWLVGAGKGPVYAFDTRTWQARWKFQPGHGVHWIDLSPDGRQLATTSSVGVVMLWDMESGELVRTLTGHVGSVYSAEYSPDGRRLLTAGQDRTVRLFDPASGELVLTLDEHAGMVFRARWSPDGSAVVSVSEDLRAIIRRIPTQQAGNNSGTTGPELSTNPPQNGPAH